MSSESDLIKVKSYYDGSEAEIAKAKLLAHGIFCSILSDNLGGQRLDLNETLGSSLLVKRSDFDKAESLLNDVYSEDDQELHQDDINPSTEASNKARLSYRFLAGVTLLSFIIPILPNIYGIHRYINIAPEVRKRMHWSKYILILILTTNLLLILAFLLGD
ncbi:MAG: hypothetical protein HRU19_07235 [Pseudobacteriovorax sp.]|nr:hypothetical protein [Pseudobacteriovorax sp.]